MFIHYRATLEEVVTRNVHEIWNRATGLFNAAFPGAAPAWMNNDIRTNFHFFDSHYYFSTASWQLLAASIRGSYLAQGQAFVTGLQFSVVPGTYNLPFGEGVYVYDRRGIRMNTAGGSEIYSHPNVRVIRPQINYDSGFLAWVGLQADILNMHKEMEVVSTDYIGNASVQHHWIREYA